MSAFRNSTRPRSNRPSPRLGPVRAYLAVVCALRSRHTIRATLWSWYSSSRIYEPSDPVLPINSTTEPSSVVFARGTTMLSISIADSEFTYLSSIACILSTLSPCLSKTALGPGPSDGDGRGDGSYVRYPLSRARPALTRSDMVVESWDTDGFA
ncbi:hypothetical protein F4778DRAFT_561974 [Xylariomycetidae sp. FL2044]|nr:hypothetical protein F4778DRAFT_561974 [Xylariomycetidae sp. FL2044]